MSAAAAIAMNELRCSFRSWTAWMVIAGVMSAAGAAFSAYAIETGARQVTATLAAYLHAVCPIVVAAAFVLGIRPLAEDRQIGTAQLVFGAPVKSWSIVLGKFWAVTTVLGLAIAATSPIAVLLSLWGDVTLAHVLIGYVGLFLFAVGTAAIALLGSVLGATQVVAALLAAAILAAGYSVWWLGALLDEPLRSTIASFALFHRHVPEISSGRLSTSTVAYYGAVTVAALCLAERMLEVRRWR